MRRTRSDGKLRETSKHLYYEIWMLNEIAKISTDNVIFNNSILESFGIHARCLYNFLFNTSGKQNYVLAIDFFDNPTEWSQILTNKPSLSNKINKRVSEELVHLTYTRTDVKPEDKKWKREEILKEINALFKQFLLKAPKARLCDELISFGKHI